jgi:hypothetical protein
MAREAPLYERVWTLMPRPSLPAVIRDEPILDIDPKLMDPLPIYS